MICYIGKKKEEAALIVSNLGLFKYNKKHGTF